MRRYLTHAAAAAAAAAVTVAGFTVPTTGSPSPPGPKHTIYSYIHALRTHNYGRACSYVKQQRGCAVTYTYAAGGTMLLMNVDPYIGVYVVSGSERCDAAGTACSYLVKDQQQVMGSVRITVTKQPSGRWRITKFSAP